MLQEDNDGFNYHALKQHVSYMGIDLDKLTDKPNTMPKVSVILEKLKEKLKEVI